MSPRLCRSLFTFFLFSSFSTRFHTSVFALALAKWLKKWRKKWTSSRLENSKQRERNRKKTQPAADWRRENEKCENCDLIEWNFAWCCHHRLTLLCVACWRSEAIFSLFSMWNYVLKLRAIRTQVEWRKNIDFHVSEFTWAELTGPHKSHHTHIGPKLNIYHALNIHHVDDGRNGKRVELGPERESSPGRHKKRLIH